MSQLARNLLRILTLVPFLLAQACNSPFQVKQVYSPQLVIYGIVFRGDSSVVIRVETNSKTQLSDSMISSQLPGLNGVLTNETTGDSIQLVSSFEGKLNFLQGILRTNPGNSISFRAVASNYLQCSANATVIGPAIIYPSPWTNSSLREPAPGSQDPQFTIYPSSNTMAIRLVMLLVYQGTDTSGKLISGTIMLTPSYQQDTTSYFLRVNGATTAISFPLSDYISALSSAVGSLKSGTVVADVKLLQLDATLYDYYSISNGFNDPLTMRTERPVFTNVNGGLGFLGSASYDSLDIQVFP